MDAPHLWLLSKEFFVLFHSNLQNLALRVHLPSRITLTDIHFGASQFKDSRHRIGHIHSGAVNAAALAAVDVNGLCLMVHANAGQVTARLHHVNVLTHGIDTIIHCLQGSNQASTGLFVHSLRSTVFTLQQELHGTLRNAVFLFDSSAEEIPLHSYLLLARHRNRTYTACFARNGIVQSACLYIHEAKVKLLLSHIEESGEQFVCIGTFLVYVVSAMASIQSLYFQRESKHSLR